MDVQLKDQRQMAKASKFSAKSKGNHPSGHSSVGGFPAKGAMQSGRGQGMSKSYMGGSGAKISKAGDPSGKKGC